ncbi:hypothetical protein H0H87_006870 [Tephrocybe sp. NHM501043]|nr:hypothetical protein H0H87_006870 [Tephrocybe sp. NHM501043]
MVPTFAFGDTVTPHDKDESLSSQYELKCQMAGVTDNPHCNLSLHERFALLRNREIGWRNLCVDFKNNVLIPKQHAQTTSGDHCWFGDGVLAFKDMVQCSVHCVVLPSKETDAPKWSTIKTEIQTRCPLRPAHMAEVR